MQNSEKILAGLTHSGVLVETLQNVPAPVPVFAVIGESVHVEQTLYSLWSQQVVSVGRLHIHIERGETKSINVKGHQLL